MLKLNFTDKINRSVALFLLINLFSPLLSQTNKIDSIKLQLATDSLHIYRVKPVLPAIAIDQRNSFLGKTKVNISGFQVGVRLYEKHTMGIGYYSILSSQQRTRTIGDNEENLTQNLKLVYLTTFYYYPAIDKKYFEIGFPVEGGLGYFTINIIDSTGRSIRGFPKPRAPLLVFGTGISMSVKPLRWIGLNITGGYRLVKDRSTKLNFNGPFYAFGVILYVHQIIQDTRYFVKKRNYKKKSNE